MPVKIIPLEESKEILDVIEEMGLTLVLQEVKPSWYKEEPRWRAYLYNVTYPNQVYSVAFCTGNTRDDATLLLAYELSCEELLIAPSEDTIRQTLEAYQRGKWHECDTSSWQRIKMPRMCHTLKVESRG